MSDQTITYVVLEVDSQDLARVYFNDHSDECESAEEAIRVAARRNARKNGLGPWRAIVLTVQFLEPPP